MCSIGGTLNLRRNSSTNNVGDGFLLQSTSGTIVNNTATGNGDDGFLLFQAGTNFGPSGNTLTRNTSENNGNDGFDLSECAGNVLNDNTALLNTVFDLSDDSTGTGTAGTANTWTNNTFDTSNPAGLD